MNCPEGFVEHTNGQASRYNTNNNPYFWPQQLLDVFFFFLLFFVVVVVVVVVGPFVESFVSFSLFPFPAIVGFWNRAV